MKKSKPAWVTYIHNRIKNNKNFICPIIGKTGSGKSWCSLSIAEMLMEDFKADYVVFRGVDILKLINDPDIKKKGLVIIWDEAGIDLSNRSWQSTINKLLNFLLQTFRHQNIILFMTVPYVDFVDAQTRKLLHASFETVTIDKDKGTVGLKCKHIQYNSTNKKYYHKYLRKQVAGKMIPIRRWHIPKPSKELIDAYEERKKEFTSKLNVNLQDELMKHYNDNKTPEDLVLEKLSPFQVEIYNFIKGKESYTQQDIIESLNSYSSVVSRNLGYMRKKGVKFDKLVRKTPAFLRSPTKVPIQT